MLDRMIFINHLNQKIEFGKNGVYLEENSIRDYKWEYTTLSDKIVGFNKKVVTIDIPILIVNNEKNEVANEIYEICERGINANIPGKLWIGNYYLSGYIFADSSTDFVYNKVMKKTLKFVTDEHFWIRTQTYMFRVNNSALMEDGLGYPYDYPYDYLSPKSIQNFTNETYMDANFEMTVYGPVENPMVSINGNVHKVNVNVDANEFLKINSKSRTILRTNNKGKQFNEFSKRDKSAGDVFKLIEPGKNKVILNGDFNVDITIFEERSEPKWI